MEQFITREKCPICEGVKVKNLFSNGFNADPIKTYLDEFYNHRVDFNYLKEADFVLEECGDCRGIYQKFIPAEQLMKRVYDQWIDPENAFNRHVKTNDLTKFSVYAGEVSMMIALLKKNPGNLKFFDFGMGWGEWCSMARGFGCDVYGTDFSETRTKHAQSVGIKSLQWNDIPDHLFDFINTEQVFEHISTPFETFKYLTKSLSQGGIIKISVPNGSSIHNNLKKGDWSSPKGTAHSLNPVAPLEHINCFTNQSILFMAAKCGFKQVKIPILTQIQYAVNWSTPKKILNHILRPFYTNILNNGTCLYFTRA